MLIEEEEGSHDLSDDSDYAASQHQGLSGSVRLDSGEMSGFDESAEFEVVYSKDNVAIHPTQMASERISGRLRLVKQGSDVFLTWIPYKPGYDRVDSFGRGPNLKSPANDRNLYTIKDVPLKDLHSVRRHTPVLGWQYVIIVLSSGLAYPPLYFYNGGVRAFLATLKQHVLIIRSADDANVFLVNNFQDPLQKSLSSLELSGAFSIANGTSLQNLTNSVSSLDSRRPDGVGYDVSCSTSEYGGRHKHKVNDSAHDISLQVLEKFSLLTKFARDTTSHIFRESQNNGFNAYEKKQKKDSVWVNETSSVPNEAEATPVEILENSDTLESDELNLVWGKPRQRPLGIEEWEAFLDSEGRIMDSKALRKRVFYGGVEHGLRKEIWKFLLGYHAYDSTFAEREYLATVKKSEYEIIKSQWQNISAAQARRFTKFRERRGLIETGTLTCNSMEFMKCSVAGTAYGRGVTEVEKAMAKRKGSPLMYESEEEDDTRPAVKGFNFKDGRVMNGNWVKEPRPDVIQLFFRLLAVCHTAIPDTDETSGKITYEAESPDEAAFVIAARELGFEFYQRTQTAISLHELDPSTGKTVDRSYILLNILEFNSTRKRMSVIVRTDKGKLLLLTKGADNVMFERLAKNGREFEEKTKEHLHEYADAGLRTLVLAYRELDEEEYTEFNKEFTEAKNAVSADREAKIDQAAEKIEKDLILLGATAVEDKLQNGVPECIDKLAQAGIKIWVLTGDKMETAVNIGFACSLLRQGMKQIIITLESPDIVALEKEGNKDAIVKAHKDNVVHQISDGKKLLSSSSTEAFALIIDGKSLAYALEDDVKNLFLQLAVGCASVICCRSSPKQKALVTRLVKAGTGKVTLAIGDGANDVGMLQEADIGIGISGAEGMQAVMSSDIAIAQFRFLERLLLVHGHWCYRRISSMICYFFYKNITFGVTLFLYEAYTTFSGQPAYNDWFMSCYNVFFTSLPVIALGVFDQDVSARFCLKFPLLYQEGVQNVLFSWLRILGWMFNGILNAVIIFFLTTAALQHQAFRKGGEVVGLEILGATMYTIVVWVVNLQMALSVSYFTLIHHIFIWGGIALWYIFLLIYGAITPSFSTTAYQVFVETLAPAPSFWIVTLLVTIATLVPYLAYASIQTRFFPMYHAMIQWIRLEGRAEDPEYCHVIRQRSVRPTTVGVSARLDRQITSRVHHVRHSP